MPKKYIEMEAAIIGLAVSSLMPHQIDDAAEALRLVPAANVAPVRHGRWERIEGNPYPSCSECGCESQSRADRPYCQFCGAKMEGEKDDEP